MAIVRPYQGHHPVMGQGVFLADFVSVTGKVEIGDEANVWHGCVLRGDVGRIRIGKRANIQDLSCIHMTKHVSDAIIEDEASIGHAVVVHGAIIGAGALIGMGSIIMDNARIGEEALVGAGSLVTADTVIPPRSLALGRPAKVLRQLTDEEAARGRKTAERYLGLAREHLAAYAEML